MAQTTTSSTVHHITKYVTSKVAITTDTAASEIPWKYHTGEQLRLILDVMTTGPGSMARYLMRVSYLSDEPSETQVSQSAATPEVVLEKVDLSSFSGIAYHGRELPLKAVYKNSTVGFRYLFPLNQTDSAVKTYRRFQITFKSESDASKFVASIQSVCPCDKSKNSAPQPSQPPPTTRLDNHSRLPKATDMVEYRESTIFAGLPNTSSLAEETSLPIDEPRVPVTRPRPHPIISGELNTGRGEFDASTRQQSVSHTQFSIPSSSSAPSPLSSQPLQGPSASTAHQEEIEHRIEGPILSALRQGDSNLYKLSFDELRQLVGEVIREPGFPGLVGRVHKLWKEQAVLDLELGLDQR